MAHDSGHLREILSETAALFQSAVIGRPEANVAPQDLEGLSLEEASAELPDPVRGAFALEALSDATRQLASCEATWGQIDELVRRFLRGRRTAISIVGLRGTGRRAYLQRIESIAGEGDGIGRSRLRFDSIRTSASDFLKPLAATLGLDPDSSADAIAAHLVEGPRRVIVIERAHNLYMRKVGGFEALRVALALLASTLDSVLWVLEFDRYAWEYLEEVLLMRGYFDLIVEVPLLSRADLAEVFERQIESLGEDYPTKFLAPKDLNEQARRTWREEGFFTSLHASSHGNLGAAGILFCRATRWSAQLRKAVVLPIQRIPFEEALSSYPRTSLLALALLVEHEELSQNELAGLLLISEGLAQSILDTFVRHSVTSRTPAGRYVVNTPWLAAIGKYLSKWNIL